MGEVLQHWVLEKPFSKRITTLDHYYINKCFFFFFFNWNLNRDFQHFCLSCVRLCFDYFFSSILLLISLLRNGLGLGLVLVLDLGVYTMGFEIKVFVCELKIVRVEMC